MVLIFLLFGLLLPFAFAAMVVASKDKKLAHATQQLLASSHLRISTSRYTNFIKLKGVKFYMHKLTCFSFF